MFHQLLPRKKNKNFEPYFLAFLRLDTLCVGTLQDKRSLRMARRSERCGKGVEGNVSLYSAAAAAAAAAATTAAPTATAAAAAAAAGAGTFNVEGYRGRRAP